MIIVIAPQPDAVGQRQRLSVKMLLLFNQFRWDMQRYDRAVSARPHHHHHHYHEGPYHPPLATRPCPFLTTDTCCDNNVWSLAACRADVAPSMSTKVARSASWLETTLALPPTQSPTPISFRIPALDGACLQMFVAPNEFGVLRLNPNCPAHMNVFVRTHTYTIHTYVSRYLLDTLNWVVNF